MIDQYLSLIDGQWNNIAMMYDAFRAKKPIIEYDVDSQRIYSYPGNEYIHTLTVRTRNETKRQYEEACDNSQFMLFIKDKKNKKLKSYIFDVPE